MNICMISQYLPNIGGIENLVSDLSRRLARKGNQVSVVAPAYPGTEPFGNRAEDMDGVQVFRFKRSGGFPFGLDELRNMNTTLRVAHREQDFDILHAHFAKNEALVGALAAGKLGLPLITTVHGSDIMDSWGGMCEHRWSRFWVRQALKRSFKLTTVSHFLKERVLEHGIPREKLKVIHNWIDPEEFSRSAKEPDDCGHDAKEKSLFRIFTARRLVEKNGVDLLLRALDSLEKSALKGRYRLDVLAGGPQEERLKKMCRGKEYLDRVHFQGPVSYQRYLSLLRNANLAVVPSRWEGFGMVVLEAMAAGTPVVATKVGGIPEIIRHRENGFLVKPESSSIAEGILELWNSPGLREEIRKNGRESVNFRFHYKRAIKEWTETYQSTKDEFKY